MTSGSSSTATCRSRHSLASVSSRRKPTGSLLRRLPQRRYLHRARPEPVHCLAAPIYTTQVDVTRTCCPHRERRPQSAPVEPRGRAHKGSRTAHNPPTVPCQPLTASAPRASEHAAPYLPHTAGRQPADPRLQSAPAPPRRWFHSPAICSSCGTLVDPGQPAIEAPG